MGEKKFQRSGSLRAAGPEKARRKETLERAKQETPRPVFIKKQIKPPRPQNQVERPPDDVRHETEGCPGPEARISGQRKESDIDLISLLNTRGKEHREVHRSRRGGKMTQKRGRRWKVENLSWTWKILDQITPK